MRAKLVVRKLQINICVYTVTNKYAGIAIHVCQATGTKSLLPKKIKNNSQYPSDAPTLVHRIEERTDIDVCVQLLLPLLPKVSALLLVSLPTGFLAFDIAKKCRKTTVALEQVITRRPASEAGARGRVN